MNIHFGFWICLSKWKFAVIDVIFEYKLNLKETDDVKDKTQDNTQEDTWNDDQKDNQDDKHDHIFTLIDTAT